MEQSFVQFYAMVWSYHIWLHEPFKNAAPC